ncbi:hypothetical protein [Convivina praedatoris]|uniref:Uncharacterized protein n=1 Tax=Convivina praedatoris TaxID=2880963 RepID=A0ABN8H7U1_9LACO|nr:hypothetical protein [Convivina sp. LMG 32447]CAH1851818.1 hypothetical protein LMG032447_00414 [Convivina sp. LMG 32447]CAH1851846.1 hypothetical protein R078138_00424 [Convivina sp. LMG 32447]CAH1853032.1 hypothetical protein R077815_00693 [Convivina sp. LMG 32447]
MQKVTSYPKLNIKELDFRKHPHAKRVNWQGYKITIAITRPNYGGVLYWLVCPYCGKRKSLLYHVGQAEQCRVCAGLYYPDQDNKARRDGVYKIMGLHEKQLRLINKLDPALYNSYMELGRLVACDLAFRIYRTPKRPKGMHWTTYARKLEQIDRISLQLAKFY